VLKPSMAPHCPWLEFKSPANFSTHFLLNPFCTCFSFSY
jgi:hypothetical protein